jgi:RHS repeat-associated protein
MEFATGLRTGLPPAPADEQDRTFIYYHGDHLGSSNIVTDRSGEIVQHVEYTPYGEIRHETNLGVSVNRLYTGQELDKETGLYYYNARYYDSRIGRFISPDTIIPDASDSQQFNRYSYVLNNPVMNTDPTGHVVILPGDPDYTDYGNYGGFPAPNDDDDYSWVFPNGDTNGDGENSPNDFSFNPLDLGEIEMPVPVVPLGTYGTEAEYLAVLTEYYVNESGMVDVNGLMAALNFTFPNGSDAEKLGHLTNLSLAFAELAAAGKLTSLEGLALLFDRSAMLYSNNAQQMISALSAVLAFPSGRLPDFSSSGFASRYAEGAFNQVRHAMAAMVAGLDAGGWGIAGMQLRELFGRRDIPDFYLNMGAGSIGTLVRMGAIGGEDLADIIRRDLGQ